MICYHNSYRGCDCINQGGFPLYTFARKIPFCDWLVRLGYNTINHDTVLLDIVTTKDILKSIFKKVKSYILNRGHI